MNPIDLSPLVRDLARAAVGFDAMLRDLETAGRAASDGYPPFNVEDLGADRHRITLAVAGFRFDELEVVAERGKLTIKGKPAEAAKPAEGETAPTFLHRGIARRAFTRTFLLAEYVEVEGASLEHGLLTVTLRKIVPEAARPRAIAIETA